MRVNERYFKVQNARNDIAQAILKASDVYDLTFGEIVQILGDELASWAKFEIRVERHGDADKPGDRE